MKFWLGFLLFSCIGSAAADNVTRAVYDLYYRDIRAGQVTVTVTYGTAHTYYEATATPNLLANLFGLSLITERGVAENETLRPAEYFYEDASRERHYKYVYDWRQQQALIISHQGEARQKLTTNTLDPAAMALVLLRDVPKLQRNYSVLSRGQLKVYRFDPPILERMEVLNEMRDVWKIVRKRGDAEESRIITWHDPKRNNWMVRTLRTEQGKERVRLELAELL